jgi:predicted phage terminase large subunit-like protein
MLPADVITDMRALPMEQCVKYWDALESEAESRGAEVVRGMYRALALSDLFYLLVRICRRTDMLHPWIYARCREVEADPDNHLDLWSREHYKSTIITFGMTIKKILNRPEITVGIFSHTRPQAKKFLRQIKQEFEGNKTLHHLFPDILWGEDTKQSPKWSEDDGIIVKRKSNPKEATVEAWGLVDGQPIGSHFDELLYDDIVTAASVTTPEMIEKTLDALELSYNLGTIEGVRRFAGTRYHFNDSYATLLKRGTAKLRFHPGRAGGEEEGASVFWPEHVHLAKRRDMGPYTYAAQILLNPKADSLQGFKREWVKHYKGVIRSDGMTKYILVDAASSRKKGSDYTAMMVVGLGRDRNYYILDMIRDRLSLTQRADRLFTWHRKYHPMQVRYERYGMMADIEHIENRQNTEVYHFPIVEVAGRTGKTDRIRRLLPLYEQSRVWMPESLHVTDWEKNVRDLVQDYIEEEYVAFPNGAHDDMMDCLARIAEPELPLAWPKQEGSDMDFEKSEAMGMVA